MAGAAAADGALKMPELGDLLRLRGDDEEDGAHASNKGQNRAKYQVTRPFARPWRFALTALLGYTI
jgi:hypothetical protein